MRIVVVAGEPVVRIGLRAALVSTADLELVAERADARSAFPVVDAEKPDLLVMDVVLGGMNGITATREMKRRAPETRVLLFSTHARERDAIEGFAAGADGFALKTDPMEVLLGAFRTVGGGGRYITPSLRGLRLVDGPAARRGEASPHRLDVLRSLSPREREVLDLVLKGLRNREIARELCVSMKTIDTHRSRINRKLGCSGSAALIRFAADNGLLHTTRISADVAAARAIVLFVDHHDPERRDQLLREVEAQGYALIHASSVHSALAELEGALAPSLLVIDVAPRPP